MTWHPIETAPKDRAIMVWWTYFNCMKVAKWQEPSGQWFFGCGIMLPAAIPCEDLSKNFSHWMPLPEPPAPTHTKHDLNCASLRPIHGYPEDACDCNKYKSADLPQAATVEPVTVQDHSITTQSFYQLVLDAQNEAYKAMRKFPQPNYVLLKVAEEAGEVVKAAVHFAEGRETRQAVENEMRQTIAMLFRLWVEGDEVNGVSAIAGGRDE